MNNGMQYIVVQGRAPQDGSKALEALVIFPAWVSPTLVCAGMSGRVIELTDGSIKEGGPLPYGESEVLAGLAIGVAPVARHSVAAVADEKYQTAIDERDQEIERLRLLLDGIRRMTKKGKA